MEIKMMKHMRTIFSLTLGTLLMSIAINGLLAPNSLLSGGVSGLALFLHLIFDWKLSLLTIFLNIPLFILAFIYLKKRFIIFSLLGMSLLSLWLELTQHIIIPTTNPLSIILVSGLLNGLGMGIIFRAGGSVGGTDIVAKILNQKLSFSMGSVLFLINMTIMLTSAFVFGIDIAVVTAASMFVSSQTTNYVVDGLNRRRTVTIITSPASGEKISHEIMDIMGRGVTIVPAIGGYTQNDKAILYTTVNLREVAKLKALVSLHDTHAFVTIADTAQVIGNGRGFIPLEKA
ncbi:MAG: YitT family protein [Cellulosilyticaceae bacterium]